MSVHIFGIRHHGPGSARSLLRALEELRPDALLVEGPPDAEPMLSLMLHAAMRPPVSLLLYARDEPKRAVYYPFAEFSPEWQALRYGLAAGIPVRFMDLPQTHALALGKEREEKLLVEIEKADAETPPPAPDTEPALPDADPPEPDNEREALPDPRRDPLLWLAMAAGYSDGERWWDHLVEHRRDGDNLFEGILEAMTALREEVPPPEDPDERRHEDLREAWMRRTIREVVREGRGRIAVVCGAWHGPALARMPAAKVDDVLLKGLPKLPVLATWTPWTHGRLSMESGYGAGIESPGWYHHLWSHPRDPATRWMTRVARLLRGEGLDASSAHVIEAVRLGEALAALRDRPLPGLPELNEATRTVLCFGDDLPMRLIRERLIVGEALGEVPDETPTVPLQQDLQREQKRLRLAPEASHRDLELDLRGELDLDRSRLLHRLNLLGIPWGQLGGTSGKGTFKELWRIQWHPEWVVNLIEAGIYGSTLLDAATALVRERSEKADLPTLTALLDAAILATLPDAVTYLMGRIQAEAAVASDVAHLMDALPPLVTVARYGSVRKVDPEMVRAVVDGLVARVAVGLPYACSSLNDEAAEAMYERLLRVNGALAVLNDAEHLATWRSVIRRLADSAQVPGLIGGRACRMLLEAKEIDAEDAARRFSLALSTAAVPADAAAWAEG
ncbi:MAG TPA: DUF5682 family protein, partial [Armatimonadota bacterium]|nr:DUF5682 family protein [Armatimonadota bacterium]